MDTKSGRKTLVKTSLGRPRGRWQDNNESYIRWIRLVLAHTVTVQLPASPEGICSIVILNYRILNPARISVLIL
jgi:hypothetical protein